MEEEHSQIFPDYVVRRNCQQMSHAMRYNSFYGNQNCLCLTLVDFNNLRVSQSFQSCCKCFSHIEMPELRDHLKYNVND
jgi:hypothetical protein